MRAIRLVPRARVLSAGSAGWAGRVLSGVRGPVPVTLGRAPPSRMEPSRGGSEAVFSRVVPRTPLRTRPAHPAETVDEPRGSGH